MSKVAFPEMASMLAERSGISIEKAQEFLSAVLDTVIDGLGKDKLLKIKGLGTFKVIEVKQRKSVDVNTGKDIIIESREKITFTPDAVMKDFVNRPFSQFETVVLNHGVDFSEFKSSVSEKEIEEDERISAVVTASNYGQENYCDDENTQENDTVPETEPPAGKTSNVDDVNNEKGVAYDMETTPDTDSHTFADKPDMQCVSTGDLDETCVAESFAVDMQPADACTQPVDNDCEAAVEETAAETITTKEQNEKQDKNMGNLPNDKDGSAWKRWLTVIILIALVGLIAYYLFDFSNKRESDARNQMIVSQVMAVDSQDVDKHSPDSAAISDSVKKANLEKATKDSPVAQVLKEKKEKARNTTEAKPKPEPLKEKIKDSKPHDKPVATVKATDKELETSRRLVKYGAYDIVGTDRVITVKKGQTMASIAKVWLGKDMACYIEVHNGVKTITEGQKINIPKLVLKKKNKK